MFINKVGLYIFYVLCNSYLSNHVIDREMVLEPYNIKNNRFLSAVNCL